MKNFTSRFYLGVIGVGLLMLSAPGARAQSAAAQKTTSTQKAEPVQSAEPMEKAPVDQQVVQADGSATKTVITDWSSHRMIFSNPAKVAPSKRQAIVSNPRYIMQLKRQALASRTIKYNNESDRISAESASSATAQKTAGALQSSLLGAAPKPIKQPPPPPAPTIGTRDWNVSLGSGTVAAGQFPAEVTAGESTITGTGGASPTGNCLTDFVVFGLNTVGTNTQANLIAFDDLYSGTTGSPICGTTANTKWAYNTSTMSPPGSISNSPVTSGDGTMVAFVENNNSAASLHILKWKDTNGTVTAPVTPTTVASMSACSTAPCMATVQFTSNGDAISSPFYDFITDTVYVGDNDGFLFAITGVFYGTPTVSTTAPFSAGGLQVSQFFGALTAPVFDFSTGNIFVGSADGYLYAVNSSTGGVTSLQVGNGANSGAIIDPPTVDGSNARLIVAAGTGSSGSGAVVMQADTTTPLGSPVTANIGSTASGSLTLEQGTFDNNYYNWSGTGANPGHFYAIGTTATTTAPTLYEIPFSGVATVAISGSTTAGYTNPTVAFSASPQGAKFTATGNGSGGIFGITGGAAGSGFTAFPTVGVTGTGTGAAAAVTDVSVLTGVIGTAGSNYMLVPTATINGTGPGGETGTTALGLDAVAVTNGGTYTTIPTATFSGGSGTGKTSVGLQTITVSTAGSYTNVVPTVTFTGGTSTITAAATASMGVNTVTLTAGGSNYATVPNVSFTGGGAGTGATGTAALGLDVATVTAGGTYTSVPTVSFAGGSGSGIVSVGLQTIGVSTGGSFTSFPTVTIGGSGAGGGTASAVLGVTGANVTAGGTNYTTVPTVAVNGTGSGATATAALGLVTGTYAVSTGGSYTGLPSVSFPGGSGAGGVAIGVSTVSITNAGSGYTTVPTFTFSGTHTTSAVAAASMGLNAIALGNAGTGYTTAPTISITGGTGSGASATGVTMKVVTATLSGATVCYSVSVSTETISLTGGSGSGATVAAHATSRSSCTSGHFQLVIDSVNAAGSGYTASPSATVPAASCFSGCSTTITSTMGVNAIAGPIVPGSYTALPTVAFSGGGGSGATLTASYSLVSVGVSTAGSYTTYPTISISGGTATVAIGSTTVVSVVVSSAGTGYTAGPVTPSITGGPGSGAAPPTIPLAVVSVAASGGSYTTYPTLTFSGGGGTGAGATAVTTIQSVAIGNPGAYTTYPTATAGGGSSLSVTAATVVSIAVTAGTGYTAGPVTAGFTPAGATATADLKVVTVTVSAPGSGYTSDPAVSFDSGSASGTTTIKVVSVNITTPGAYTVIPTAVHFSSGTAAGSISAVTVVSVAVTAAGTGYTAGPVSASFSGTGGAVAAADLKVVSLALAGGGGDYTRLPTVTITPQAGDTTGAGATASLTVGVLKIGLTSAGNGYSGTPTVTVSGGGGTGSTGWTATIAVNSVVLTYGGGDYSTPPTVTISGGSGAGITGVATINPGTVMTTGTSTATLAVNATTGVQASPLSDVFNEATNADTIFYGFGTGTTTTDVAEVSVSAAGALGTQVVAAQPDAIGGTSGIVIDPFTSGTNNQANSIYFATQGTESTDSGGIIKITAPGTLFSGNDTVTVTMGAAEDFASGDTVIISGVTCTGGLCGSLSFNGTWVITMTNTTTFTYIACTGALCGAATETGTVASPVGTATDNGLNNAKVSFKAIKLTQSGLN